MIIPELVVDYLLSHIDFSIFDSLGASKKKKEISRIINNSYTRFTEECTDKEIAELYKSFPFLANPATIAALAQYIVQPTSKQFEKFLEDDLRSLVPSNIPHKRITKVVNEFIKIFREELVIGSIEAREKINALVNLKTLETGQKQTKSKRHGDYIVGTKIQVSNSMIGLMNTGIISNVEQISTNLSKIDTAGSEKISKGLIKLTEAVIASTEISKKQKKELVEQLAEVSKQAALPKNKRASSGVIKAVLTGISGSIAAVAGLAQIWTTWGPSILKYFGL